VAREFINLVHIYEYEIPDLPRQRYKFVFSLFMEKMQLVGVLPCYLSNKHFVKYVARKEGMILFGYKNPYRIIIFHLF